MLGHEVAGQRQRRDDCELERSDVQRQEWQRDVHVTRGGCECNAKRNDQRRARDGRALFAPAIRETNHRRSCDEFYGAEAKDNDGDVGVAKTKAVFQPLAESDKHALRASGEGKHGDDDPPALAQPGLHVISRSGHA